jgi:flagellar biogenesis protein FliO
MRPPFTQFWLACALLAVVPAMARGQYGDPLPPDTQIDAGQYYYSRPGPVALDEPQQLPPLPALEARPIDDDQPAFQADRYVPADRQSAPPRSPFPVTLARAEQADAEPVAPADPEGAVTPLKLSPRSERSTVSPAKPIVPTPANAVGTVAGSLGIVLGLFLVIVWISRRFAPAGSAMLPKEAVELLGRAPLVGRHQAQLVRVGNKLLLVALTPAGCETLTEVTEPTEVEHLLALCRRSRPGSSTAAFNQVLGQLASEPSRGGFAGPTRPPSRGAA